jgi:hypothetical protein
MSVEIKKSPRFFAVVREHPKRFPRGEAVMEIAQSDFHD